MADLIERGAVVESLRRRFKDGLCGDAWWNSTIVLSAINETPSAQPERKTGRWIPVANGRGGHECALCHEYAPSYQSGEENLTYFCPNCGAEMSRGDDENA